MSADPGAWRGVTHVLHWIPPELIRSLRWFGRKGYWELQTADAWNAGSDDAVDSTGSPRDASVTELTGEASVILGCEVTLTLEESLNGQWLLDRCGRPVRKIDAPVYLVTPAGGAS